MDLSSIDCFNSVRIFQVKLIFLVKKKSKKMQQSYCSFKFCLKKITIIIKF